MLYLVQFEILDVPSIPREDFLDLLTRFIHKLKCCLPDPLSETRYDQRPTKLCCEGKRYGKLTNHLKFLRNFDRVLIIPELFGLKREWEYFLRFKRKGKVLAGGSLAGRRGAVAIFDVDDNDEIEDIISNLPLFAHLNRIEVTPLIDINKALADTQRMLRLNKSHNNNIKKKT